MPVKIPTVHSVHAATVAGKLMIGAIGEVPKFGWSNFQLSPIINVTPPANGVWEFSFLGDPPHGEVFQLPMPAVALYSIVAPDWLLGVKIKDGSGRVVEVLLDNKIKISATEAFDTEIFANPPIYTKQIANFEDSWQVIGLCGPFNAKMKKLVHELVLNISGPDRAQAEKCVQEAFAAGVVAALIALFTAGGAWAAAAPAFLSYLSNCLPSGYTARLDDRSHWEEWCT